MTSQILRCQECGSYALSKECSCGGVRVPPKPAKYGPEDKYGVYRRKAKRGHESGEVVADMGSGKDCS